MSIIKSNGFNYYSLSSDSSVSSTVGTSAASVASSSSMISSSDTSCSEQITSSASASTLMFSSLKMSRSATVLFSPICRSLMSISAVCGMYFGRHSTSTTSIFCTSTPASAFRSSLPIRLTGTVTLIAWFWSIAWKSTCKNWFLYGCVWKSFISTSLPSPLTSSVIIVDVPACLRTLSNSLASNWTFTFSWFLA